MVAWVVILLRELPGLLNELIGLLRDYTQRAAAERAAQLEAKKNARNDAAINAALKE